MNATVRHLRPRTRLASAVAVGTAVTALMGALAGGAASAAPASVDAPAAGAGWRASVGPGWVVDATSSSTSTTPGTRGPFTIALISPTGVRHVVAKTSQDIRVVDVSPDGKRALAVRDLPDFSSSLVEWDLVSGTSHVVLPSVFGGAEYTRPAAAEVLVADWDHGTVNRVDLGGHVVRSYPTSGDLHVASSGDGTRLVAGGRSTTGALDVLDSATGRVLRQVALPVGYTSCAPTTTYDATQVVVRCTKDVTNETDVARVSTTTGTLRLLTHTVSGSTVEQVGYSGAWKVGGSVLAQRSPGCGFGAVGLVTGGHVRTELTWPAGLTEPRVAGVSGTSVVASTSSCFSDQTSTVLATQDALTHATVTLDTARILSAAVVAHE